MLNSKPTAPLSLGAKRQRAGHSLAIQPHEAIKNSHQNEPQEVLPSLGRTSEEAYQVCTADLFLISAPMPPGKALATRRRCWGPWRLYFSRGSLVMAQALEVAKMPALDT